MVPTPPQTREEQLLAMIATLQQQVSTMLLQQQGSRVEVARPQVFSGKMEEVSAFVNAARLYIRMKMMEEAAVTQVAWVLSYVQGGIVEAWKDNLLDELAKGESEVETVEQLFTKIRNDFGETSEEERKIEQLRTIEQEERTCNKYVQEFKKVARGSGYEGRPLIEEFKRGLNRSIRRKLAEAEEPPTTIGEWQERVVRLDRNQRQSRMEERMLERNAACPGENAQPRGRGLYGGRAWLTAHNPKIDWEKGEVKMMHCPPICGRRKQEGREKKVRKIEKDKDEEALRKLVPRRFWKWKKVFGKRESERMLVRKAWDHAIELKEGFMPKKGKGIFTIERGKGRGTSICRGSIKEKIHLTLQVAPNITSTLCGKKGWHTEDGTRLSTCKPVDNKEWVSITPYCRYIGWSREEKGVYEAGSKMEIQ